MPSSLHSSHRARTLTSSSGPRVTSQPAAFPSLSQAAAANTAGGGSLSRLARHSPSYSISGTGSPVSFAGSQSAGGSSGQLTSLVLTQLNILLSTIKDEGGDPAKWLAQVEKIQKLVEENGMEVFAQYFRRLLQSNVAVVFPSSARQHVDSGAAGSYQLLVKEMQKLLQEPQQAEKIAEALDTSEGDLFRDFDLSTFIDHFRLSPVAKVALVLPCRSASKADLRSKGIHP